MNNPIKNNINLRILLNIVIIFIVFTSLKCTYASFNKSYNLYDVKHIVIESESSPIELVGSDKEFKLNLDINNLDTKLENGVLTIKEKNFDSNSIKLYIPNTNSINNIDIVVKNQKINIDNIKVGTLNLNYIESQSDIKSITQSSSIEGLNIECSEKSLLTIENCILDELNIISKENSKILIKDNLIKNIVMNTFDFGTVYTSLKGNENDYNYKINCSNSITLGEKCPIFINGIDCVLKDVKNINIDKSIEVNAFQKSNVYINFDN